MKTKSSDDIRYFWNHYLLPLLVPSQTAWTIDEDLALLNFVSDEDLRGQDYNLPISQSQSALDFSQFSDQLESKSHEQCRQRWFVLLKGLGSYTPGSRVQPSEAADQMIKLIKTKSERYTKEFSKPTEPQTDEDKVNSILDPNRLSKNEYIDIVQYYQLQYLK